MSIFKKFGIVAAAVLVAGSALASNFRGADQVYVPAAGHVSSSSVTFITDVFISNLSTDSVTVTVLYASGQAGTSSPAQTSFTLAPLERREFVDYVAVPVAQGGFGLTTAFGQLIFNGCKQGTDCGTATQDPTTGESPNFRNIAVQTRTYSVPLGSVLASNPPTNGQLFSGIPWYNYVSSDQAANKLDKVFMTGIRQNAAYRTNLGVVNASQFSNTQIVFKLYSGSAPSTVVATSSQIGLGPLGFYQQNLAAIFPNVTFPNSGTNMFVTVEQTGSAATSDAPASCQPGGCPGFFAYGSELDALTQDATTLEPMFMQSLTSIQYNCLFSSGTTPCKGTKAMVRAARH